MIETKKCEIYLSHGNPCEITCSTCMKKLASIDMPMEYSILKSLCDAYIQRCQMGMNNDTN